MSSTQTAYVAEAYTPRARDYVTSAVHSTGADLDQMEAVVRGRPSARVLDLGCGGGHVSYRAAPHVAEVVACDLTQAMLDQVRATAAERGLANIAVRQAAAEALPFPDGAFDIVLCRYTTHHWADMKAGLREARRVLAAQGQAVFVDSLAPAAAVLDTHLQAVELLRDPSHVRNYSLAEWQAALSAAGFGPAEVTWRKVRMDYPVWIARTRVPPALSTAIRMLQDNASAPVRTHFAIGEDGGFDLDVATMVMDAA